jgi:two-component system, response regulator
MNQVPSRNWILLGEDDPNDALLTKRALAEAELPHAVVEAFDGVEVLDCLRRRNRYAGRAPGHPSVVLLDLKMPRMDGIEVLRAIKADPELRCVPVVIYTASVVPEDMRDAYQAGANGYVIKSSDYTQFKKEFKLLGLYWATVNFSAAACSGER